MHLSFVEKTILCRSGGVILENIVKVAIVEYFKVPGVPESKAVSYRKTDPFVSYYNLA